MHPLENRDSTAYALFDFFDLDSFARVPERHPTARTFTGAGTFASEVEQDRL